MALSPLTLRPRLLTPRPLPTPTASVPAAAAPVPIQRELWPFFVLIAIALLPAALLVAQSRVEAGIHSAIEVVAGAALGAGVTLLLFQIWG